MYHESVVAPGFRVCQDDGKEGEMLSSRERPESCQGFSIDGATVAPYYTDRIEDDL